MHFEQYKTKSILSKEKCIMRRSKTNSYQRRAKRGVLHGNVQKELSRVARQWCITVVSVAHQSGCKK